MVKIRLRNFNTVIYTEEHTQEVEYLYTIEDSNGFLKIDLTIPEEADPVEYFVYHLKDLYKGFREYICYHDKYRYRLDIVKSNNIDEVYLSKIRMY